MLGGAWYTSIYQTQLMCIRCYVPLLIYVGLASMTDESAVEVKLTEEDIPGAKVDEPMEKHAIPELKWWLLCRGVRAPSSLKKQQLIDR